MDTGCNGCSTPDERTRRSFVTHCGAAIAASLIVVGCSDDGPMAPESVSLTLQLADHPELAAVGGVAFVSANGVPLAVVRTGDETFTALWRACPHQGTLVNRDGDGFRCPNHDALFALNGSWTGGYQTSALTSFPAAYSPMDGTIMIG